MRRALFITQTSAELEPKTLYFNIRDKRLHIYAEASDLYRVRDSNSFEAISSAPTLEKAKRIMREITTSHKFNNPPKPYAPKFLSWCKSYAQEEKEMRELILGNPGDVKMLKKEYQELTGKQFRRGLYE